MPAYKVEKTNGETLYSNKIYDLPMHKDFIKLDTLEKIRN